jgi:hypothetical protein
MKVWRGETDHVLALLEADPDGGWLVSPAGNRMLWSFARVHRNSQDAFARITRTP